MPTAIQLGEALNKKRADLAAIFDEHRTKDDDGNPTGYDMPAEKVAEVRSMNDAIEAAAKAYEAQLALEQADDANAQALDESKRIRRPMTPDGSYGPATKGVPIRDLDDIIAEHEPALKSIANGSRGTAGFYLTDAERKNLEFKALVGSAQIDPAEQRLANIVPSAQYLRDVTDLFAPGTATSDTIEYLEETTFTNAAAETAETSAAPEAAWASTVRTDPVQELPVWIPLTRRALDDNAQLRSYISERLIHMVNIRRSSQLIAGDGISPNIEGVLNRTGLQTQAKAADPVFDAIHKAMTKVLVTGDAPPTGIVMHPNDWQDLRLTRTADGLYILGSPTEAGPTRLWGLDVRVTTSITENTGLVGAFRMYGQVWRKMGLHIEVSTEHSTYFIDRKVALMALERFALSVYRPAAFCSVTGI